MSGPAFIELTRYAIGEEHGTVAGPVLLRTEHIIDVQPEQQGKGSCVSTLRISNGYTVVWWVSEPYAEVKSRLAGMAPVQP